MAEVLLVEDMAGVRRAVHAMLKQAGHAVTVADTGAQAVSLLRERRFDLIVTDILMPDIDGAEILFQVKAMPRRPLVIAISGGGAGISAQTALASARINADGVLEKPFDGDELLKLAVALLGKRP